MANEVTASFRLTIDLTNLAAVEPVTPSPAPAAGGPRRLAYPLRWEGGRFATVAADSVDHATGTVEATLRCRPGERVDLSEFGLPDIAFLDGVDIRSIVEQAVADWAHPRAVVDVAAAADDVDDLLENVTVTVTTVEADRGR